MVAKDLELRSELARRAVNARTKPDALISRLVAQAPDLTQDQLDRLRAIFGGDTAVRDAEAA